MSGECNECDEHAVDCACSKMQWISVKDDIPKEGVDVLVYDGHKNFDGIPKYEIAAYRIFKNVEFFTCGPYHIQGITHWMPLPLPPEVI